VLSVAPNMVLGRPRPRIPRAEILPIVDDVVITICGPESG
jgi:hypothetical protein